MTTGTLDQIVARVGAMPPLPDTVFRLVNVVSDPESSLQQVVEVIRYDQVLTTEVLRVCNSAYFGLPRTVESIDGAVRLLGTVKIFQLAMSVHARAMLASPLEGYGLPAGALWIHSAGVAVGAQLLARPMQLTQLGLLFTAGLLHDVGKTVLSEFVSEAYTEVVRRVVEDHTSFCEAEQEILGFTHPEVGARLAESWNLPESIVNCIRYHHAPDEPAVPDPLVDAVHLADTISLLLGIGLGDDGLAYRADPAVMERHGLSETDLQTIGVDVIGELRAVQELFAKQ